MGSRRAPVSNGTTEKPEYNVALLGALGVGKSALTVKYITRRFIMEYDPTLEDTYTKTELVEGQVLTVHLMDTYNPHMQSEGDESPSPPSTPTQSEDRYLKWAGAFVVVYSITDRSSFDIARAYLDSIMQYLREAGKPDIPVALVGNKMDLERYRTVSRSSGEDLAAEYDCQFYETSAAEDYESVEAVFHEVIRDISRVHEQNISLQPLFISEPSTGSNNCTTNNNHTGLGTGANKSSARSLGALDAFKVNNKQQKEEKEPKVLPRRTVSTFKLFNKSFKIFN